MEMHQDRKCIFRTVKKPLQYRQLRCIIIKIIDCFCWTKYFDRFKKSIIERELDIKLIE